MAKKNTQDRYNPRLSPYCLNVEVLARTKQEPRREADATPGDHMTGLCHSISSLFLVKRQGIQE